MGTKKGLKGLPDSAAYKNFTIDSAKPRYLFDSLLNFREFIAQNAKERPEIQKFWDLTRDESDTKRDIDRGWFGKKNINLKELLLFKTTKYQYLDKVEEIEGKVENALRGTSSNSIPKRKMRFNDIGLGVFTFDKAAQGMFQLKEFYSPVHNAVFDKQEVQTISGNHRLISDHSPIVERGELRPNGKPKIRTTKKKVFAYFPKAKKDQPSITIITNPFYSYKIDGLETVYSGVTTMVLAKKLLTAGYKVRIISAVAGISLDTNRKDGKRSNVASFVEVKKYEEPLDPNLLGIVTSDPQFCRFELHFAVHTLLRIAGNELKEGTCGVLREDGLRDIAKEVFSENMQNEKFIFHSGITSLGNSIQTLNSNIDEILNFKK